MTGSITLQLINRLRQQTLTRAEHGNGNLKIELHTPRTKISVTPLHPTHNALAVFGAGSDE